MARRLAAELKGVQNLPGFVADTVGDNTGQWKVKIPGPPGTPYEGGLFNVDVGFPDKYPHAPPAVNFNPYVYHPNVDPKTGIPCLDDLTTQWSPTLKMTKIFTELQDLLANPNPGHVVDENIGNEFVNNRGEFDRKAREWTQKYAQ